MEHAVERALAGPLVDKMARELVRQAVIERVMEELLAGGTADHVVARVVESPATEELVARVVDSRLTEATVAKLLSSAQLWVLVDEIAQSPAVMEAVTHQSRSFADQVAEDIRVRSRGADAAVERTARRIVRRRPRPT
jgi:hypothetical protein